MRFLAVLVLSALLSSIARTDDATVVCQSSQMIEGNFVVSATLAVNVKTGGFLFHEEYTPLFPQWPPYAEPIEGTATLKNGFVVLQSPELPQRSELRSAFATQSYFGIINGMHFIGCGSRGKFEKLQVELFERT